MQEAFAKTKRILNISVSSTRKFEVPQLLNYLTAPNVVSRQLDFLSIFSLCQWLTKIAKITFDSLFGVRPVLPLLRWGFTIQWTCWQKIKMERLSNGVQQVSSMIDTTKATNHPNICTISLIITINLNIMHQLQKKKNRSRQMDRCIACWKVGFLRVL